MASSQLPNRTIALLRRAQQRIAQRRLVSACVQGFTLAGSAVLVLHVLSLLNGLREGTAALACVVLAGAAGSIVVGRWMSTVFLKPPVSDVAVAVERRLPHLMDSLVCAAELEGRGVSPDNPIEQALVDSVGGSVTAEEIERAALPAHLKRGRIAFRGILAVLVMVLAVRTDVLRKAAYGLGLRWNGMPARGILVTPGDSEAARGTDLRVEAEILRWEQQARIEVVAGGTSAHFPMNESDDGFHFTLYGIEEDVSYRVVTPSLSSQWFDVDCYVAPAIEDLAMELVPPAYSGRPPVRFDELRDSTILAGGEARFSVKTNVPCEVLLAEADGSVLFQGDGTGGEAATLAITVGEERRLRIRLRDSAGREKETREFVLTPIADAPPVVEIVEPEDEAIVRPGEAVFLQARAVDDLGVVDAVLHCSVAGEQEFSFVLHAAGAPDTDGALETDLTVQMNVVLEELGAEAGDVIACHVTATDNRRPEPQTGRSEILFIEVRPDIEPIDASGGQPQKSLDVQRIIAELRRLIRLAYDARGRTGERANALRLELVTGLSDLRNEVVGQMEEIPEGVPAQAAAMLLAWYKAGLNDIELARNMARSSELAAAINAQEKALSTFTKLAQELMKNSSSEPSEGEGQGQAGQESEEETEGGEQRVSLKQAMEKLKNAETELRRLADRQAALNQTVARSQGASLPETMELAARQNALSQETDDLRADLAEMRFLEDLAGDVADAGASMADAESSLSQSDLEAGGRHGARAQRALLDAADRAQQIARQLASRQMNDLAAGMAKLSEAEKKLAKFTREAAAREELTPAAKDALRKAQRNIAEKTKEIASYTENLATDLAEVFPRAGRELSEAIRAHDQRDPQAKMAKSQNALLYERLARAADLQAGAAADLERFSQEIYMAGQALPKVSRDELLKAMAKAKRAAAEARSRGRGERARTRIDEAASALSQIGLQLNDIELMQIPGDIARALEENQGGQGRLLAGEYLDRAARMLRKHLLDMEVKSRQELSRKVARPPEKYEKLVEEYFKALSEGR